MWDFFIKNSKFAYLFLLILLGIGTYSVITIPKESAPEVIVPIGVIGVAYPGTPAADIETLITNEIERGLSSLENVKKITSTSKEGFSSVVVEFEASADLDSSIQDLKDEVDIIKADLPEDSEEPFVAEVDIVDQPILTIAISAPLTDSEFTALANKLEDEIESVSGVSKTVFNGIREREIAIIVDQAALFQYEISLNEIINAVRNANVTFPIGQITNDGISYNVAFEGDISSVTQIPNIGITTRGGQTVYLRDVATVEDGLEPATSVSRLSINNQPSVNSISIDVYKQSGGDVTKIAAAVNERMHFLQTPGALLNNIEVVTVLDAGKDINKDLIQLSTSGTQTVILVVLLLVVTVGWREGLLAGAAIPLSFLFGFIGLKFSGNTINFLSLFALILGIGILVDSAIVMIEGINKKIKKSPTAHRKDLAIEAIHEFASPLISGTLTTVSMFAGLLIVSGVIGQYISSIPFTLIFLLFASLFVALAILPLLAATFLKHRNTSPAEEKRLKYTRRLESWYRSILYPYIHNKEKQQKFLVTIFAALVLSISLAINIFIGLIAAPLVYLLGLKTYALQKKYSLSTFKRLLIWYPAVIIVIIFSSFVANSVLPSWNPVKVVFFEEGDLDFVIVEIENLEGTTKEVTDIDTRRVEEILYNEPNIESFTVTVGSGSQFVSGGTNEKLANIFITLKDDRTLDSGKIVEQLRNELEVISDVKITVNQPSDGPPAGAAIIVKFLGDDLGELTNLANQSAEIFRNTPNSTNVETSTNNNSTEFVLELDRDKTAALGLNPFTVSQIARTAVYGTKATSLTTLDEDIDVVVKMNVNNSNQTNSNNANEISINDLERISIPTQKGTIPLSHLVTTSLRESSAIINHENNQRMVTVTADVTADGNVREVQAAALAQIKAELNIPDDITISTGGGETDESNKAFAEMGLALVVGILLMVGILVLQFNSYLHMRYVLSILPYSLIGIMFGLAVTFSALSFPSIMGFIALSGIVVNNSILLIDMMNNLRKENPERDIDEIVLEASSSRLRPILLTAITTVIGMVPLTYAGDMWAPLAYAVMFGLVFSVIITLALVPILYTRHPGEVEA